MAEQERKRWLLWSGSVAAAAVPIAIVVMGALADLKTLVDAMGWIGIIALVVSVLSTVGLVLQVREPRQRWNGPRLTGTAFVLLVGLVIFSIRVVPFYSTSSISSIPDPSSALGVSSSSTANSASTASSVQAVGLSASVSEESYRLVLYLGNLLAEERSVERLHLIVTGSGVPCAELAPVVLYEVRDVIVADVSGEVLEGAAAAESGLASGFEVPVEGSFNYGCAPNQLQLSFSPPAAVLERLATTPIVIDVPRMLGVTYRSMPNPEPAAADKKLPMPGIGDLGDAFVAFRVTAETVGASKVDSCFMFARSASSGPRDCDDQFEGEHVFWRQVYVNAGEYRYER